jgi:predicted nucleic acid-binding protein
MVLVDSSIWIEALRRNGDVAVKLAVEGLLDADATVMCSPVRLEVLGAVHAQERRRMTYYLSDVTYRACDHQDWENAITLSWRLRDRGVIVPWLDVLIAAVALQDGARVYSIDKHFDMIARETGLLRYQPGYGGVYVP